MAKLMICKGDIYIHYKGYVMEVLGNALHTETGDNLIIYHHLIGDTSINWARPASMWNDEIIKDGVKKYIFEKANIISSIMSPSSDNFCDIKNDGWYTEYNHKTKKYSTVHVTKLYEYNGESFIIYTSSDDKDFHLISATEWFNKVPDGKGNYIPRFNTYGGF